MTISVNISLRSRLYHFHNYFVAFIDVLFWDWMAILPTVLSAALVVVVHGEKQKSREITWKILLNLSRLFSGSKEKHIQHKTIKTPVEEEKNRKATTQRKHETAMMALTRTLDNENGIPRSSWRTVITNSFPEFRLWCKKNVKWHLKAADTISTFHPSDSDSNKIKRCRRRRRRKLKENGVEGRTVKRA